MADDLLVSFAEFEKARDSCFDPVCDTVKSLDTFLNETFTLTDMSLAIFKTTEKALWHVAVVYFTESSYVKLCEELQRWLYAFFRQVGLIFKQIKATGLISSSILLYFVVEVLCSLAKLHGAHCCGMTVKEECLDITYSESNTPELDNEIAAEVQAIYDHIMNTRSDCSVKTHFHEKTNCLEALLGRHDRSWIGFLSAIIQGRHVQTYRFVRDLAPENDIRVCQICMEHLHKAQFPKAKITDHCDHATTACLECLSQFLSAQVGTVTWDRITCPICPSVIGFTEIEKYASVDTSAR
ncbi:hypothetical protein MMC34_002487 [Xylographa carneopallida]|nr:hypothetical protein [Xylographa carneopallida]